MEKGTRKVRCPYCLPEVTILRIYVSTLEYGKTVDITCPKCKGVCRTTIPVPATEPAPQRGSAGFPFGDTFSDIFDGDIFGGAFKPKK